MYKLHNWIIHSPSDLATFFASPFASWMDRYRLEAPDQHHPPDEPDAMQSLLSSKGDEHEAGVLQRFVDDGRQVVDIATDIATEQATSATEERRQLARDATIEAIHSSVDVIFQPELRHRVFAGRADFLLRCPGASELGDYHYEIWDAKLARRAKPAHLLQLCCYAEMLLHVQGSLAEHVVVATGRPDAPAEGDRTRIADCYARYQATNRLT